MNYWPASAHAGAGLSVVGRLPNSARLKYSQDSHCKVEVVKAGREGPNDAELVSQDRIRAKKEIPVKRATASKFATAYHEAGHAVAAWRLNVSLGRAGVTIVSDGAGAAGSTFHRMVVGRDIQSDNSNKIVARAQKLAQICVAGSIAQRKYNPRCVRHYHSQSDRETAIDVLSYLSSEPKEPGACLRWLHIRTQNMFSNPDVWRAVERLADALVQRGTIRGKEATGIILAGFNERMNASIAARARKRGLETGTLAPK